eukprot:4623630-Karenia_brevis.AAC.1
MQHTKEEAGMGRTTQPTPAEPGVERVYVFHPRFVVEQSRADGSRKLRAIDHESWAPSDAGKGASLNGHTMMSDKIRHHTLDDLGGAIKHIFHACGVSPALYKADIYAAFRR